MAALVAAPLQAQSMRMAATIPFEFWVASQRMPAGEYALVSGGLPGALYLTKSDQGAYTFTLGKQSEGQSGDRSGEGKLVLHLPVSIEERRLVRGPSAPGFERVSIQAAAM